MPGVAACAWPNVVASSHPGRHCARMPLRRPFVSHTRLRKPANYFCRCRAQSTVDVVAADRPVASEQVEGRQAERSHTLHGFRRPTTVVPAYRAYCAHRSDTAGPAAEAAEPLIPPTSTYTKAERKNLANIPESEMSPETLRRWRISKANKGRQPWNKGRKHTPGDILSKLLLRSLR